jgi:hypothetical protein
MSDGLSYKILRFYMEDYPPDQIDEGLTLEEAQAHCQNPTTSSVSGTAKPHPIKGPWFDGYSEE